MMKPATYTKQMAAFTLVGVVCLAAFSGNLITRNRVAVISTAHQLDI